MTNSAVLEVRVGSRLWFDGEAWSVCEVDAATVRLNDGDGRYRTVTVAELIDTASPAESGHQQDPDGLPLPRNVAWASLSSKKRSSLEREVTVFSVLLESALDERASAVRRDLLGLDPVVSPLSSPALRTAAAVVAASGIFCTYAAQLAMGTAWRIGVDPTERTELVTSGPFAFVRNPIFTTALITFTGLALASRTLLPWRAWSWSMRASRCRSAPSEEPHLLATHGRAYADYAARVGRFVPGIGRLRPTS
ncbi:MAG: isoprenylcysteine carboxylmethyltransferase family protein [Actinobacteria bacterium]|uniref:Isoprenylcysteine carboxyl methyltransferase n=1 Tax=Nostocoides veronense TaxID=330836 RepID=A0ABP4XUD3_9MICO|nr:isoprenylcysteine carboxylmethyltransferase family protein [Actinomycetota bacterium]